jgi:hypothetical protein
MPKRLAITIAGAVSLGSYEAGVLYEVIRAIGGHNTDPATTPNEHIEIDVLTGASAGGMTAAIATQKLLFEAGSLDQAYKNSLYRPWVKDVDIVPLLALQNDEDSTHSILSSDLVENISKKHLTLRYEGGVAPTRVKHSAASDKIRLGLAVSNLNGVDWCRRVLPNDEFIYTRYQDEVKACLDSADPSHDSLAVWEFLRSTAVASGAFPFAFRAKTLARHRSEYFETAEQEQCLGQFASDPRQFTYTDGGVFQNEPLGLAKHLVDLNDPGHTGTDSRFYLFVAPQPKISSSSSQFNETIANLGKTGLQLLGSIFNQARFHDWIQAEEVNDRIRLFNERAIDLKNAMLKKSNAKGYVSAASLAATATALLNVLFANQPAQARTDARKRLQAQFQLDYDELANASGKGAQLADVWLDAILTFETAADLGDKDEMRIYGITASDAELASAKFEAFLGFFDQRYRDHDYDVGRTKAREFLTRINTAKDAQGNLDPFAPIRYSTPTPDDLRPIDQSLNGLELRNVSWDLRKQMKDRLTRRAHDMLAELNVPFAGREAIDLFFITPQLNKLLGL